MSKKRQTLRASLPTYQKDRSAWRRRILASVLRASEARRVQYNPTEQLEVVVLLYLKKGKRERIHDVDNRLKDILDALQGRFGGPKSRPRAARLIENDNQVYRVVMEKQPTPKMYRDDAGGRLLIRPYRARRWPLQAGKDRRLFKGR